LSEQDVIVVGAGMVGSAIALGLAERGLRVLALDGGDGDFRAAQANFGLVWLQGKGFDMPPYQALTRRSVRLWDGFARRLVDASGIDLQHEQNGGLAFCLGEAEFEARELRLRRLHNQLGDEPDFEMLDRPALERLLPGVRLGPAVTGASFGRLDGHANPLRLLAAMHRALVRHGGRLLAGHPVTRLAPDGAGFEVAAGGARFRTEKVVIAAGIGSGLLARQVGLEVPVRPQRGQLLVTERFAPVLPYPASGIRQTREGSIMVGVTQEEVGPDVRTTVAAGSAMSRRALQVMPALAGATLVRHWAGLRVMTPDSYPVYAQSAAHPGAFVTLCHSGVTLAAIHADEIAGAIAAGALPQALAPFHPGRFDVPNAA
jgi:glycine/D-amino acid oxidase-like deaminating enzyme